MTVQARAKPLPVAPNSTFVWFPRVTAGWEMLEATCSECVVIAQVQL